jgi:hypothetical protein
MPASKLVGTSSVPFNNKRMNFADILEVSHGNTRHLLSGPLIERTEPRRILSKWHLRGEDAHLPNISVKKAQERQKARVNKGEGRGV